MTCDIELRIDRGSGPGEYRVEVVHAAAGGEPESTLALDVEGLLARRDELERALLASSVPARSASMTADQAVLQVGEQLFRSLFEGPVNNAYRASLGVAQQRGERLRVVLRLAAPELAGLPWEMLYDADRRAHLCLEEPIVRRVAAPYVVEPLTVQPPLRVLGLIASPRPLRPLDMELEVAHLTEAVEEVVAEGLVSLEWVTNATWDSVHHRLLSGEWHVVHFIGHGDYDPDTGGLLAFENEDGRLHLVEASQLAYLLGQAKPTPRLVVLNSCSGGEEGKHDLFSGTASKLVHSGIDAVAAMQFAVSDQAAIAFARGFYTSLAAGRGVDEAVGGGRIAILGMPNVRTLEWATPVLYLRGNITHPIKIEKPTGNEPPAWLEYERTYDAALADLRLGRLESAAEALRRLLDHDPDYRDAPELYQRAQRALTLQPVYDEAVGALDDNNPQRALELVDRILQQSPEHEPANQLRQRALHDLTPKMLYPDDRSLYKQAEGLLGQGDAGGALDVLDRLDEEAPDYPGANLLRRRAEVWLECMPLYDQAVAAMGRRKYKTAAPLLDQVLELDPAYRNAAALRVKAAHALVWRRRALLLGGPTLVVAGVSIAAWFLLRSPATLSDNEVVVSVRDDSGRQLVAVDVESGEVRPIDAQGGDDNQPNPSPDRTTIAYLAQRPDHQPAPRLVDVDGSNERALLTDDAPCPDRVTKAPAWAPDGERLAVVCVEDDNAGRGTALYTMSASGSNPTLALSGVPDIGAPAWSSEGLITVWVGPAGQQLNRRGGSLVAVDPETCAVEQLTEGKDTQPDWHGTGRLVFVRYGADDTRDQIRVLEYGALERQDLPAGEPDVSGCDDGTPGGSAPRGSSSVLVEGTVKNPTWSPDGRRIAYLERDGNDPWRLMVMDDDGSDRHQVDLPGIPDSLSWGTR